MQRTELLKGTLDLLLLRTLELGPRHGIGIASRIARVTAGVFQVRPGSLFPALHRLEAEGFIAGEWTVSRLRRRVKTYRLTDAGRDQLTRELDLWAKVALAVTQVLQTHDSDAEDDAE